MTTKEFEVLAAAGAATEQAAKAAGASMPASRAQVTQAQIAAHLNGGTTRAATISRQVSDLAKRKHLKQHTHPGARTPKTYELTAKGARALAA